MLGIISAIGSVLGAILTGIINVVVFLITHPKFLLTVAIVLSLLFGYVFVEHRFHIYKDEIVKYQKQEIIWNQSRVIYESNTRMYEQITKENQDIFDKMKKLKAQALQSQINIANANAAALKAQNDLNNYIATSPKADDGPVAPVLKNTITQIDKLRQERNSLWGNK